MTKTKSNNEFGFNDLLQLAAILGMIFLCMIAFPIAIMLGTKIGKLLGLG